MTHAARALALASVVIGVASAHPNAQAARAVRYLMGTWCELTMPGEGASPGAAEAAFQEIARLEQILSNWNDASEISRLNASAGRGQQDTSRDLAVVTDTAAKLCTTTHGAFDPTIGSVVHAWGFDTDTPSKPEARPARLAAAHVRCDRVRVKLTPPSIALATDTRLDLGGIGKGYAVDRALDVLRAYGVTRARLDFGSSSLGFIGEVDGGWPVVIADPRDLDTPLLSFRIAQGAVSSSGQRERSFVGPGGRYGHIFDPRTGTPVASSLLLVTVIAPTATIADGLSTALFVMGAADGARYVASRPEVGAIFVEAGAGHDLRITTAGSVPRVERSSR